MTETIDQRIARLQNQLRGVRGQQRAAIQAQLKVALQIKAREKTMGSELVAQATREASLREEDVIRQSAQNLSLALNQVTESLNAQMSSLTASIEEAQKSSTLVGLGLIVTGLGAWCLFFAEVGRLFISNPLALMGFSLAPTLLVLFLVFWFKDKLFALFVSGTPHAEHQLTEPTTNSDHANREPEGGDPNKE
jgi:hypothetical protein